MTQIAFSELTKRYYFLPVKGKKVDITEDIKEIIFAKSPAPEGWVSEAAKKIVENLGEYVSRLDKRGLGLPMGDEVAVMQMEHLVEQILINPDSDVEVPEY